MEYGFESGLQERRSEVPVSDVFEVISSFLKALYCHVAKSGCGVLQRVPQTETPSSHSEHSGSSALSLAAAIEIRLRQGGYSLLIDIIDCL